MKILAVSSMSCFSETSDSQGPDPLPRMEGHLLGLYLIGREIGRGGMGIEMR